MSWRNHVKYVVSIRKFGEKIIGHGKRRFLTIGLMYCPLFVGENTLRIISATIIQRNFRSYLARNLVSRYLQYRRHQEEMVKRARKTREIGIQRIIMTRWFQYSEKMRKSPGDV